MRIELHNGESYEMTAHSIEFPEKYELLNGILLDSEEMFAHLSDFSISQRDFQETIPDDEVEFYDLSECDPDLNKAPFNWIVASVGNLVVRTAEEIAKEQDYYD